MSDNKTFNLTKKKSGTDLENFLRPQWTWKTFVFIISVIILLTVVSIDLEIDFISIFSNSLNYFGDIFERMLPPDFSDFNSLVFSMIETIEIAILGTFIAIILSIPLALLSARNIAPNIFIFFYCKNNHSFF